MPDTTVIVTVVYTEQMTSHAFTPRVRPAVFQKRAILPTKLCAEQAKVYGLLLLH